jgi:hypothetical protein
VRHRRERTLDLVEDLDHLWAIRLLQIRLSQVSQEHLARSMQVTQPAVRLAYVDKELGLAR